MARHSAWCEELERDLARPFPTACIAKVSKGGRAVSFVSWHLYVQRLNDLVGYGWSMGEPVLREVGGKLVMGVSVSIFGVSRINFGSEEEEHGNADDDGKVRDFGSAETNSFAQAFKRTCALFGLGLSLYDKTGALAAMKEQAARGSPAPQPRGAAEAKPAASVTLKLGGTGLHKDTPIVDCPDAVLIEARDALDEAQKSNPLKPAHEAKFNAINAELLRRDQLAAEMQAANAEATP